jgi:hypothetical protein
LSAVEAGTALARFQKVKACEEAGDNEEEK